MELKTVGIVRNGIMDRKAMPPLGAPSSVVILEDFAGALLEFDKHSHVWVLVWLDRGGRDVLQVTPRGGTKLHGVFAVRSPVRPNPIGLTAARVVCREGLEIRFDRLDFLDGTPVVDVKPYFVSRDLIFSANNARVGNPVNREAERESLVMQAVRFHGEDCPETQFAADLVLRLRQETADSEGWTVSVPLYRPKLIDALMGILRVSPGRGTLRLSGADEVVFEKDGRTLRFPVGPLADARGSAV